MAEQHTPRDAFVRSRAWPRSLAPRLPRRLAPGANAVRRVGSAVPAGRPRRPQSGFAAICSGPSRRRPKRSFTGSARPSKSAGCRARCSPTNAARCSPPRRGKGSSASASCASRLCRTRPRKARSRSRSGFWGQIEVDSYPGSKATSRSRSSCSTRRRLHGSSSSTTASTARSSSHRSNASLPARRRSRESLEGRAPARIPHGRHPQTGAHHHRIIDDTGFLKQGTETVGFQRHYATSAGKIGRARDDRWSSEQVS